MLLKGLSEGSAHFLTALHVQISAGGWRLSWVFRGESVTAGKTEVENSLTIMRQLFTCYKVPGGSYLCVFYCAGWQSELEFSTGAVGLKKTRVA